METEMTKFESAADKEQQQASQRTLHKTNKNRPNVFQKYKFQCISLTRKNSILIIRNKLSSLAMLLAPTLCLFIFGMTVIDSKQRELKEVKSPKPFFCLGEKCESASTRGGEGSVFPKCLIFDRKGGKYGYGKLMPGAKCTSVMYAPSGNSEVKELFSILSKKAEMSHSYGGTGESTVNEVVKSDVFGMDTTRDLDLWMQKEANLGYVTAVVKFNASATDANIGPNMKYEVWYNQTIVEGWYREAGMDNFQSTTGISSFALQLQRSVNEGLLGLRNKNSANAEDSSLTLRFKRFPEVPATAVFRNRLCSRQAAPEAGAPLWIFLAIMVDFSIALVTVVGEKEKGILGAMRTVGVSELVYWLSWLLYFGVILFFSILLLIITGIIFGDTLPLFQYTEFGVLFPVLFLYGMTMISIAFLFSSCIGRVQTATRIAGGVFGLGLTVVNFFVSAGPFLAPILMDPLILSPFWRGLIYGAVPPVAFGTVIQHLTSETMPVHRLDPITNITSYSSKLYTTANFTGGPFPIPTNPNDNVNEYIYKNMSSLNCPIGTDPVKCYYHQIPMSEVMGPMYTMFFLSICLSWYFGQVCSSAGSGRRKSFYFPCDPRYWGILKRKTKKETFSDQDDTDPSVKLENKRCREGDKNLSAVRVADLVKQYGRDFKAVNGMCVSMEYGQIFALLGHNGAGKTTSIRMMTGLENISSGEADIAGFDVSTCTQEVRDRIGICPQHDILWPQLTAKEHLEVYSLFKGSVDKPGRLDEILHGVKLYDVQNKQCGKFSGGMKRRLSVAIAAMGNPDVIFLDEPTTGMDPMNKKFVWDMIHSLKDDACVVLTTHSMEEADALGDRIGIMSHGRLVALGTALQLKTQHGSGYRVKIVTTKPKDVKNQVSSIVPSADLVDDSAGSLSYAIHKESMDQMPALFRWVEENLGQEGADDSIVTDWAVSNTTLEEVFIQLARKEQTKSDQSASSTTKTATEEGHEVQLKHEQPKAKLAESSGANNKFDIGQKENRPFEALIRQRFAYQYNQRRSNQKLFCCPLFAMVLLLIIFALLDDLVKLEQEKEVLGKKREEENCKACKSQANALCSFCSTKGTFVPGEDMCFDNSDIRKFKKKNEWDEWDEELQYQPAQLLGICQVCDYCRHFTFDTVDSHPDDGSRQITVGNASHTLPWKKNWNGTKMDRLGGRFSLPSPYSFLPTYLQTMLQSIEGCDAMLEKMCSLNNTAADFATASMCSCNAEKNEFKAVQDGVCLRACMEHEKNIKGGLTDRLPFYIPETIDEPHQSSIGNNDDHQWFLLNSVSTTSRIGVVATEENKKSYVGSKLGGYSETFEGAKCWSDRSSDSLYNAEATLNNDWFPYTTKDFHTKCEFRNTSDARIALYFDNPNATWDEKTLAAVNSFKPRSESKFASSGLAGEFPQNMVFVENYFALTKQKWCGVNGTAESRSKCPTKEPCTCISDKQFDNQWNSVSWLKCADTSCDYAAETCPGIQCLKEDAPETICSEEQVRSQRVYLSPTYEAYDTASTIDVEHYNNQKKILDGTVAKMKFEDGMSAMETVDKLFLSAAMIFNKIDENKVAFDTTLQSYFTGTSNQCDLIGKYPMAAVRKGQNEEALHECDEVQAEWRRSPWFPPITDPWNVINSIYKFGDGERGAVGTPNWLVHTLSNGILKKQGLGNHIQTGFKPIPFPKAAPEELVFIERAKSFLAEFVINLVISMTLSPLLTAVVQEKELKLKAMMRMMGMEERVYYIVTYLWNFFFTFAFLFWLWMVGIITGSIYSSGGGETIFSRTDGLVFILLFLVYAHAQAVFVSLLSNFFHTAKKASSAGFFVMLGLLIISMVLNGVYEEADWKGQPAPFYVMLIPPVAIFRALYLLNKQAMTWETLTVDHEVSNTFGWLLLSSVIWLVLDNYLSNVMPRQYGTRRRWDYPFQTLVTFVKEKVHPGIQTQDTIKTNGKNTDIHLQVNPIENGSIQEDNDVTDERGLVLNKTYNKENSKILTYDLNKMYGSFCAVNTVTFHVAKGECFGLLGPNGAGKTTTISMLTGLFPPSRGNAIVSGFDLKKELKSIYDVMGICPQFDICWPDLDVEDHLYFYARLKGINKEKEKTLVDKLINEVGLSDAARSKKKAKELSGGMRRRLSLAMALIGEPEVVFLDEPTTGLDPETKRNIWALLDKVKRGRCIVLTTHSMDEADALCERIGIMSHGLMRCLGTNLHLKNKYGNGYKIEIRFRKDSIEKVHNFIIKTLPKAEILSTTKDTRVYQVFKKDIVLSEVFDTMQHRGDDIGILDYGVRQTSLEEVFLKIARESEAAFHKDKAKK